MRYEPPAIVEHRELVGRLGEPSGIVVKSDRTGKGDIEPVRWATPTVEERRDVRASLGDVSLAPG